MRVLCVVPCASPLAAFPSPYGVPLPCLHSVRTASPQPCFSLHGLVDRARPLSLRPATPPRGVLRIPAQNPLWPRGHRRPIPPALFAECRRKRCRLHLSICAIHEPCTLLAHVCLPCAERGVEAAARGGASADGGTRKTPRMRSRGATGGIPTKRPAAQARLDCAPYGGCARGSRQCAEESGAFGGKPRKERSD